MHWLLVKIKFGLKRFQLCLILPWLKSFYPKCLQSLSLTSTSIEKSFNSWWLTILKYFDEILDQLLQNTPNIWLPNIISNMQHFLKNESEYNIGYASSLKCKSVVGYSAIKVTSNLQRPKKFFFYIWRNLSQSVYLAFPKKKLKSQKKGLWVLSGVVTIVSEPSKPKIPHMIFGEIRPLWSNL